MLTARTYSYPRPEILRGLPAQGHVIIEASAGTGKTYTLEHLVVDLLLRDPQLRLEQLLVVTFTERATAELKARVRGLLTRILNTATPWEPSGEGVEDEEGRWLIGEADRARLERALFSFDVAPIYTIHGFCQRVLTEYAFAHRRLLDQRHVELPALFERAFTDAMRRTLACQDDTRRWLEAWLEVGSVEELRALLLQCVVSGSELWPRFREEEFTQGLTRHGDNFWGLYRQINTRPCAERERAFMRAQRDWILRRDPARFLMLADDEIVGLKHALRDVIPETPEQESFLALVGRMQRFKPAIAQKFSPVIAHALEQEKQRSGLYTFDDMLTMVRDSLTRAQGAWLIQALRRRYRHALIDEFQDTDEVQWDIFRRLFHDSDEGHRLVLIGDPKQAIYGWRGADVYTYLDACRVLAAGDASRDIAPATTLRLSENFRSTAALISAYNTILDQRAPAPFFSGEAICYEHPVRCGDPKLIATDALGQAVAPIVMGVMRRRDGEAAPSATLDDLYTCYGRWVASEIQRLLSDEGAIFFGPDGQTRRLTAGDIYVLTRSGSDELRLERFLREAGVPYTIFRQEDLFKTPPAGEVLALLRAIDDPHDRSKRLKAWETPFFGLSLDQLERARDLTEADPHYRALLGWHQLGRQRRFEELFTQVMEDSGLVRREIFTRDDDQALATTLQLFEALLEEAHLGRLDLSELVARCGAFTQGKRRPLAEDHARRRAEPEGDAVQVMTMHKSKGLEAAIVFLFPFGGMTQEFWPFHYEQPGDGKRVRALHILKPEERLSPRLRARVEAQGREEDERLLYVALTRAKARLYLPLIPQVSGQPIYKNLASRAYNVLNRRLATLAVERERDEALARRFQLDPIPYFGLDAPAPVAPAPDLTALATWDAPPELIPAATPQLEDAGRRLPALRVESYSSLKRREGGYSPGGHGTAARDVGDEIGTPDSAVGERELPGGPRTGQFLHDVLERLDYSSLTRHEDVEQWGEDPQVVGLFEQSMIAHGVGLEHMALSQRVIFRALTATIELDEGVIYGLGLCVPNVRELEFMYPIPERDDPPLSGAPDGAWRVQRGFIKGYIDYVFAWNGRAYFVDWKSDVLERYDAPSLRQHVEGNYQTQVMLYTLALCKLWEIQDAQDYDARFGGAIYCFLRGMSDDSRQGLWRWRPSWGELVAFDEALRAPDTRITG